jgi:ketosteroid isomerase-like protein
MNRSEIEALLSSLYAARIAGDLAALSALFTGDARFEIAGAAQARPILIRARGLHEFRPWLALLIKTFRLTDQRIVTQIIDGPKAAVHWHATVHSRITGTQVPTDLIDLVEFDGNGISAYLEFFCATRSPSG